MDVQSESMLLAPTIAALNEAPRRALDLLHRAGYRAVQFSATQPGMRPRELDASARRDLAATLRRVELIAAGVDLWIPVNHYLDAEHIDRAIGATYAAIELAADLGRCPVSVILPRSEAEADDDSVGEAIDAIAAHAERFGVRLADHALPRTEHPGIGVGLDPAAIIGRGESPAKVAASTGGQIVSARLCDLLRGGMRGPVGDRSEGRLDVTAYRAALSVVGYARPIVVDARQWPDPWAGLDQTRQAWEACAPG